MMINFDAATHNSGGLSLAYHSLIVHASQMHREDETKE